MRKWKNCIDTPGAAQPSGPSGPRYHQYAHSPAGVHTCWNLKRNFWSSQILFPTSLSENRNKTTTLTFFGLPEYHKKLNLFSTPPSKKVGEACRDVLRLVSSCAKSRTSVLAGLASSLSLPCVTLAPRRVSLQPRLKSGLGFCRASRRVRCSGSH